MFETEKIDISENKILKLDTSLLQILLKDNTTKKNIIWATDNYENLGYGYETKNNIEISAVTRRNGNIIKPRVEKSKKEQQERIKQKAEVFTPSWVVNAQNNLVDDDWFGRSNVFNTPNNEKWTTNHNKIEFLTGKTWEEYIKSNRMEMTCGEAPYLVSRYDTVTGNTIKVENRVGLLDRKLRIICENIDEEQEWLKWCTVAYKSIYGFEWQGDNLLLARENLLYTFRDYYEYKFKKQPTLDDQKCIAEIISYNIWQMDGIKFVIPNSCKPEEDNQISLFNDMDNEAKKECIGCMKGNYKNHTGIYAKIKDWKTGRMIMFKNIVGKGETK